MAAACGRACPCGPNLRPAAGLPFYLLQTPCCTALLPSARTDALAYLSLAGAADLFAAAAGGRGAASAHCSPTALGRFLAGLPVSVEAAQMVVNGGKAGLLRPAVVLAAILNTSPFPIHQPFASAEAFRQNLRR